MIVTATIFEFISAQNPHSMKDLLIGILFAIKGVFQLIRLSSVMLFPFSADSIWARDHMSEHPPGCTYWYCPVFHCSEAVQVQRER